MLSYKLEQTLPRLFINIICTQGNRTRKAYSNILIKRFRIAYAFFNNFNGKIVS